MDGEKAPICYKEITTALRQWILPTFVRAPNFTIPIPADVNSQVIKCLETIWLLMSIISTAHCRRRG